MSPRHTLDLLGEALRDLAPLVAAAVQAMDKPGTRSLRRKLDSEFHYALSHYGTLRRMETPECQWEALAAMLPHYERVTEVWPGRAAFEARKAAAEQPAAPVRGYSLRLVVDNAQYVAPSITVAHFDGGAA